MNTNYNQSSEQELEILSNFILNVKNNSYYKFIIKKENKTNEEMNFINLYNDNYKKWLSHFTKLDGNLISGTEIDEILNKNIEVFKSLKITDEVVNDVNNFPFKIRIFTKLKIVLKISKFSKIVDSIYYKALDDLIKWNNLNDWGWGSGGY
ncbi:hypothetical protein [Mycoplasma crocodyli]|uniref:Uncharacterized protein n=1 Tax=Mycoplasma crocodyli (strain ATCC 51981 / MP145) TaxID=512564 RepID=D5E5L2_MYCCM|nr:hypothetical protein [Mycoplasma crocodyli]ADE19377.1 conserved hypothetical protein [Mycoplasma crocodyli MP145]